MCVCVCVCVCIGKAGNESDSIKMYKNEKNIILFIELFASVKC